MERKCRNCAYSEVTDDGRDYECHRYPPLPMYLKSWGRNDVDYLEWPKVKYNAWCGEFKDASQPDK